MSVDLSDEQRRKVIAQFKRLRAAGFYRRLSDADAATLFLRLALTAGADLLAEEGPG